MNPRVVYHQNLIIEKPIGSDEEFNEGKESHLRSILLAQRILNWTRFHGIRRDSCKKIMRFTKIPTHWNTVDVSCGWVHPNPGRDCISVDEVFLVEKIELCMIAQEIVEDSILQEPVDVGRLELIQGDQVRLTEVSLIHPFLSRPFRNERW